MQTTFQVSASKLAIATYEGTYFFNPQEIIRLEASSNYTYIYFTNRKPILIARVLADYEVLLSSFGFVRTHRSHLVNKQYVMFIDSSGKILMKDESRAEISRRKKKVVMKELRECFLQKNQAA